MKTRRLKAGTEITTRAEFDRIVDQTVEMQIVKERLELRRDKRILAVREEFEPDINDLAEKMETNVLRAEKYAESHRDELLPSKKKTAETVFAFFGFRTGNPTLVLLNRKWTWVKVIEAIKAIGWIKFIQVKESVDKDAMKANCSNEQLAQVGVRIEQHESFFIDPKRDPADPQRLVAEPKIAA